MISMVPGMAASTPASAMRAAIDQRCERLDLRQQQREAQHLQPDQHGGRPEEDQPHPEAGRSRRVPNGPVTAMTMAKPRTQGN